MNLHEAEIYSRMMLIWILMLILLKMKMTMKMGLECLGRMGMISIYLKNVDLVDCEIFVVIVVVVVVVVLIHHLHHCCCNRLPYLEEIGRNHMFLLFYVIVK